MPKGPVSQEGRACRSTAKKHPPVRRVSRRVWAWLYARIPRQAARHRQFPVLEQMVIFGKSRLRQLLVVRCLVTALLRGGSTPATSADTQFATGCDSTSQHRQDFVHRVPRRGRAGSPAEHLGWGAIRAGCCSTPARRTYALNSGTMALTSLRMLLASPPQETPSPQPV